MVSFHHSSFYFSKESHSIPNIGRRNVCRQRVVDEMSVDELSWYRCWGQMGR